MCCGIWVDVSVDMSSYLCCEITEELGVKIEQALSKVDTEGSFSNINTSQAEDITLNITAIMQNLHVSMGKKPKTIAKCQQ